jgi:hypothetical protein
VNLAEDYIKHDIYVMKIVRRFGPGDCRSVLVKTTSMLRDVFTDQELGNEPFNEA